MSNQQANMEMALLSGVVFQKDFHSIQKLQIDESYFTTPEAREVYRFLREIYNAESTHGQVPSVDMVKTHFPSLWLTPPPDSVPILCHFLRKDRMRLELLKLSEELRVLADKDPVEGLTTLRAESSKLAAFAEVGQDLSLSGAYSLLLDRYEAVQASMGMLGIPYPWQQLNEETQGMQKGQFIILFGRPKSMKTWIGIHMAVHAYVHARKRVLFYTREMSPLLVAQRVCAAVNKVDYKSFKNGKLQPELKKKVFTTMKELLDDEKGLTNGGKDSSCFVITTDKSANAGGSGGGVGWLASKIKDLKPDLVVVDGMYLMKDDRSGQRTIDWKAMAHISQDLKMVAADYDVPLIGITQANRAADKSKGDDLTELAFADAFGQDADAVFRVSKRDVVDENNVKRTLLYLTAPGLREGKFDGIVINGEPATNFDYVRTLVEEEAQEDAKGSYGSNSKQASGPTPPPSVFKKGNGIMDPKIPMSTIKNGA